MVHRKHVSDDVSKSLAIYSLQLLSSFDYHILFLTGYIFVIILHLRVPYVDLVNTVNFISVTWEKDPMTFVGK